MKQLKDRIIRNDKAKAKNIPVSLRMPAKEESNRKLKERESGLLLLFVVLVFCCSSSSL